MTLLIQCPFKSNSKDGERWGRGEEVATGILFLDFLNHKIEECIP